MGLTPSRLYLDSCIAIYLVEEHHDFAAPLESLLESHSEAEVCISDLTILECLVMPLRSGNQALKEKFDRWFKSVTILSLTGAVFVKAAQLRAKNASLKTPDALHLAAAIHYDSDEFWTNDTRLDNITPEIVRNVL